MSTKHVLQQPPQTDDKELNLFLTLFVGSVQRALDDVSVVPRGGIVVSNVTTPTTFDASTATLAQTASMVGALYNALKIAGKIT